jgi:PBP1b-binding outer membrane lipoprotein LpoB
MKKILFSIVLLFSIITFSGCTQDQVAAYQKQVDQLTVVADQAYESAGKGIRCEGKGGI